MSYFHSKSVAQHVPHNTSDNKGRDKQGQVKIPLRSQKPSGKKQTVPRQEKCEWYRLKKNNKKKKRIPRSLYKMYEMIHFAIVA